MSRHLPAALAAGLLLGLAFAAPARAQVVSDVTYTLDPADLKRYNKQLAAYHRMKRLVEEAKANMQVQSDLRKVR